MYADDTSLTLSSSDPVDLQSKLNHDLAQIQTWLQANKLSLNVKKTKFSIIGSHNKLANLNHQFDVKINEHYLERAKTYKYLGKTGVRQGSLLYHLSFSFLPLIG